MYRAYFDGACEPVNPGGTASFGAVIFHEDQRIWEASEIFKPGDTRVAGTSNNVAEYAGFNAILDYFLNERLNHAVIHVFGDSALVINQMFGTWQIRQGIYVPLAKLAWQKLGRFRNIKGQWIPRDANHVADELSKAQLIKAGIQFRIQPESVA